VGPLPCHAVSSSDTSQGCPVAIKTPDHDTATATATHGRTERASMFGHICLGPNPRSPEEEQETQRKVR